MQIKIPRNVQFIYEHSLAREELEKGFHASRVRWDNSDPWTLNVSGNGEEQVVVERAAYVAEVNGKETHYVRLIRPRYQGGEYNRTRSVNQYLTHWIYPYKGKFHPQMVRALMNIAGARPGWVLFEPFAGSGTAALEAEMLGLNVLAIDISPLCVMLNSVKTQAWAHLSEISDLTSKIIASRNPFRETVQSGNSVVNEFLEVARMISLSDEANRHRDPEATFPRNLAAMLESIQAMARAKKDFDLSFGHVVARREDVRAPSEETMGTRADLVVTSPPYSIALDYVKNDRHALEAMGWNLRALREDFIGVAGRGLNERLSRYEADMKSAFHTISMILKPGRMAVIVIGNVTVEKKEAYTTNDFICWAKEAGLSFTRELPKIVFGLYNVIQDEKILFFRKEP
ncbi:MAG: hypothetical protein NTW86_18925 [Candidatus Sumerlaeota bacterium]|nr:hypothetical protein [Candidatus Sumerlaeota bacterium]